MATSATSTSRDPRVDAKERETLGAEEERRDRNTDLLLKAWKRLQDQRAEQPDGEQRRRRAAGGS